MQGYKLVMGELEELKPFDEIALALTDIGLVKWLSGYAQMQQTPAWHSEPGG